MARTMRAAVFSRFGGPEVLAVATVLLVRRDA